MCYFFGFKFGIFVIVFVKFLVMKLLFKDMVFLIMVGFGIGFVFFCVFVQYCVMQKVQGKEIGFIFLYFGFCYCREEYFYGEEWEVYMDVGVFIFFGVVFFCDQFEKIYIQDCMRQMMSDIVKVYIEEEGFFYLCGFIWLVLDVIVVLEEVIVIEVKQSGWKVDFRKEIERLKEDGRYVLEVY